MQSEGLSAFTTPVVGRVAIARKPHRYALHRRRAGHQRHSPPQAGGAPTSSLRSASSSRRSSAPLSPASGWCPHLIATLCIVVQRLGIYSAPFEVSACRNVLMVDKFVQRLGIYSAPFEVSACRNVLMVDKFVQRLGIYTITPVLDSSPRAILRAQLEQARAATRSRRFSTHHPARYCAPNSNKPGPPPDHAGSRLINHAHIRQHNARPGRRRSYPPAGLAPTTPTYGSIMLDPAAAAAIRQLALHQPRPHTAAYQPFVQGRVEPQSWDRFSLAQAGGWPTIRAGEGRAPVLGPIQLGASGRLANHSCRGGSRATAYAPDATVGKEEPPCCEIPRRSSHRLRSRCNGWQRRTSVLRDPATIEPPLTLPMHCWAAHLRPSGWRPCFGFSNSARADCWAAHLRPSGWRPCFGFSNSARADCWAAHLRP